MSRFKNKKFIIPLAVVVIGILIGAFFIFRGQSSAPSDELVSQDLPKLDPSEIGMKVTVRKDNKALMFELTKAQDIKHVDYTIEYEKEIEGEKVPEGIFGIMNIAEDGITKTDFREFGTCSSGVCRYDKVVSDIKITLTVTKEDNKKYLVEETINL